MDDKTKEELKIKLDSILARVDIPSKKIELAELEKLTYEASFWADTEHSTEVMKKITQLKKEIDEIELMQLMFEEGEMGEAEKMIRGLEVLLFLSGP
ncbi:MAG: hypothetical protein ABIO02_02420, partial [Patescibacteria group bacterium]